MTTFKPAFKPIASGLRFPEGPVAMPDGTVILVEIERRTLTRVSPEGKVHAIVTLGGGPNGAAMGPGGKILLLAGSGNSSDVFEAGTFESYLWTPERGILQKLKTPDDMFCAGHMLMSNGDAIAAGGTTAYRASGSPWKISLSSSR